MINLLFFGEILWDIFDTYTNKTYIVGNANVINTVYNIGGAEFNKAAHAARLGANAFFVTAVGDDELGKSALEQIKSFGINTKYVSQNNLPTGYCSVTLDNGNPRYQLADNTAYDMIPTQTITGSFDALCFGTLALRGEYNRRSLSELITKGISFGDIYFDINIREGFFQPQLLDECLKHTTILKASREEVHYLGCESDDLTEICLTLAKRYKNLKVILITKDSDGALAYDCHNSRFYHSQIPTSSLVSAVGAGDSFGACFLYNYKSGVSIDNALDRAVILSDFVVTKLEAVPEYPKGLLEKIR